MDTFSGSIARAWDLVAGLDAHLVEIVARSLAVSGAACVIACGLGLAAGAWLGVSRFRGRGALLTVLIACFGRAISEVGAVMVVGGNMEGFTRVMTTAIALETSKGDLPLALALGFVLLTVVLLLNALIATVRRWRLDRVDRPML